MPHGFLIRIGSRKQRLRAIEALDGCKDVMHLLPDNQWLVTSEHMELLRHAGVVFEDLTDLPTANGDNQVRKRQRS
jgi:hypothetical protein